MICPKCQYQRKATDTAPQWQCPACGVAYAKAAAGKPGSVPAAERINIENQYGKRSKREVALTLFVLLSILLFVSSWYLKDKLPAQSEMRRELFQEPIQKTTHAKPFDFDYRGETYMVKPIANYEIWGLVVTHNDITGFIDITHDENSVDIKDLCVIWGANLHNEDYREVKYSSGDFTCYWSYSRPMNFHFNKIANNHLLSDNEAIRQQILRTKIGDQVRMKGMLVSYSPASNPSWVRNTSTTREDTGNHACEVMFVEDFEILHSSNTFVNFLYSLSKWLILLAIILKIAQMAGVKFLSRR